MEDLAEELGMSKKTLYASFSSKNALLKAVIHNKFDEAEFDFTNQIKYIANHSIFQTRCRAIARVRSPSHG